jgi:ABC-type xylose transport system permease subunit
MNKPSLNSAQMPDYLKARKLHLNGIIVVLAGMKKRNARENKDTKVETLTIDAIKAELDFIDLQLKRKDG